jgi:hypothetical protein
MLSPDYNYNYFHLPVTYFYVIIEYRIDLLEPYGCLCSMLYALIICFYDRFSVGQVSYSVIDLHRFDLTFRL